jgi:hypothetical protein
MATANLLQTSVSGGTQNALSLQGDGVFFPKASTTSRLALTLTTTDKGFVVYDTTDSNIYFWNGTAWESIPGSGDAGANGSVQYNDNGIVSGATNFVYDKVTGLVTGVRYTSTSSSASLPSYAVSAGNGIYNSGANQIGFAINSANAATLNTTGLGIGTTTPAYKLEVVAPAGDNIVSLFRSGDATAANNAGGGFRSTSSATAASRFAQVWLDADGANLSGGDYFIIQKNGNSGTADILQCSNAAMRFGTDYTNRAAFDMTLDASGNLYLKTTSRLSSGVFSVAYVPGTSQGAVFQPNSDVSSPTPIQFLNSSGSGVGSITTTAVATAYNIASDYRLKEAVQPLSSGLARVSALKPSIYKWKVDGSNGEGFLAHELADVVPFAVTGEKDAVDADGKPAYQGVDLSKLVPILVAAIQELTARVKTLEAR